MEEVQNSNIDYLLRYISYHNYQKLIKNNNTYLLSLLEDNAYNINLNIKYLIKYGISDIEKAILNNIEALSKEHNSFINDITSLEEKLTKKEIIALFENA